MTEKEEIEDGGEFEIDIGDDYLDTEFTLDEEFVLHFQKQREIQEQIESGTNLHNYSEEIAEKLMQYEDKLIHQCVEKGEKFVDLYYQIEECENTFTEFEKILDKFEDKFSDLHERISTFQNESNRISKTLKNRKEISKSLQHYLTSLDLSKLSKLEKNPTINKSFVEYVLEIEKARDFFNSHLNSWESKTMFFKDIDKKLKSYENLIVKRLRQFFVNRIKSIQQNPKKKDPKKPKSSPLLPSENKLEEMKIKLLQYSYFARFLRKFNAEGYLQIRKIYMEVAQRYYLNEFTQTLKYLAKAKVFRSGVGKHFFLTGVVPNDPQSKSGFLKVFSRRKGEDVASKGIIKDPKTPGRKDDGPSRAFQLGHRLGKNFWEVTFLQHRDKQNLDQQKERVDFEVVFQKLHMRIIQYINSEYSFFIDFFGENDYVMKSPQNGTHSKRMNMNVQSEKLVSHILSEIFQPIFIKIEEFCVKEYLQGTQDLLGVFIILKYVHAYFIPKVPIFFPFLKKYFRDYNLILWPKLKRLFDQQELSILQFEYTNKKIVNRELRYRIIIQNYSHLLTSIYLLCMKKKDLKKEMNLNPPNSMNSPNSGEDQKDPFDKKQELMNAIMKKVEIPKVEVEDEFLMILSRNLIQLRKKIFDFVQKLTRAIKDRKSVMIYKINCYDLIIKNLLEKDIPKNSDGTEFFGKLMTLIEIYATSELNTKFQKLVRYVERTHPQVSSISQLSSLDAQKRIGSMAVSQMDELAKDFGKNWKEWIKDINLNVERYFFNRGTGKDILGKIFHNLLEIYAKFREIVEACYGRVTSNSSSGCPFQAHLVGIQEIQHEIKLVCKM